MPQFTVVQSIAVHVATGETLYPGESGFASLWAEIRTRDPGQKHELSQTALTGTNVYLRCAMVDVIGKVTRHETSGDESVFVVAVGDLIYRRPANTARST